MMRPKEKLALCLLIALVAFTALAFRVAAQQPSIGPGPGSCYGNDNVPATVALQDPVTGKCWTELSAQGAPGIVADNFEGTKATYSAAVTGLAPAATATDVVELCGSASKIVRVLRIDVSGTATSAGTLDVLLVKRSAANTGGTSAAMPAVPNDAGDAAATAAAISYTANPGALGTAVGTVRNTKQPLATAGTVGNPQSWLFGANLDRAIVLRTAAQCLSVNLNGGAIPAGAALDVDVEWSEEQAAP